ncbi:NB-ARC domain-containing protein [Microseira wollei]|uniref:WD repeat-containing protein n=1 Tax=Microseira wollei NIES-4236 TaxID=2530354 RepID=A0AAV3XI96_9CYAN|nr:NB-ARC domain-containing protein [Microseira wollei]GET41293.1 WD repeat-containing protein [Microseira wollei NIES-4236]
MSLSTVIPQDFLKAVAIEHFVSDNELEVLSMALRGEPILGIAKKLDLTPEAVRKRLGEVYKKFRITGAGPGKLAKLMSLLDSLHQKSLKRDNLVSAESAVVYTERSRSRPRLDWGEAPDVSVFYGRTEELNLLKRWCVDDKCRIVALLGMTGIGKTALSVKLAEEIGEQFDYVIWRSLRRAPSIENLLDDLIQSLPDERAIYQTYNNDDRIERLLDCLKKHRCLIVLDNLESLLCSENIAGQFEEKHQDYGKLLERLGERHQSCIVITSLEKTKEIAFAEGETLPVRSYQVKGLDPVYAEKFLQEKQLVERQQYDYLIRHYRGNPLALKIASTTIKELFGGKISEFLAQKVTLLQDIRDLIKQQYERLSEAEKEIAGWLALVGNPLSWQDIKLNSLLFVSDDELFEALESLQRRNMLERNAAGFTFPPVVMEYVRNQLIDGITREIYQAIKLSKIQIKMLKAYCLDIQEERDETVEFLIPNITDKIIETLRKVYREDSVLQEKLSQLCSKIEEKPIEEIGYAADNIDYLIEQLSD